MSLHEIYGLPFCVPWLSHRLNLSAEQNFTRPRAMPRAASIHIYLTAEQLRVVSVEFFL